MNSIEMTDVDGDALTIITQGDAAWITSTSGRDEVTVGPFPVRLVMNALAPAARTSAAEELAQDLRQASITNESADALADHLLALGYQKSS